MQYIPIPAFHFLTQKPLGSYDFRGAAGGRGGAKSWEFCDAGIVHSLQHQDFRMAFLREIQKNLAESSYELVRQRLKHYDLLSTNPMSNSSYYKENKGGFEGRNGQKIMFIGLWKGGKPEGIKSLEGVNLTILEEAQEASQASIDVLLPTVLRTGISELWALWNPRLKTDPIDVFFRGPVKPQRAIFRKINWPQNPHFPPALARLRDTDFKKDRQRAIWIWNGGYMPSVQNSIWTAQTLDKAWRKGVGIIDAKPWRRVVVGVDPSGGGDDVGIVVVGETNQGAVVLEDATVNFIDIDTPEERTLHWATAVAKACQKWGADCIIAEKNFGGDMVVSTMRAVGHVTTRIELVTSSRGKVIRAEPVAAFYDQGLVAHATHFPLMESEMVMTTPLGYQGEGSPNRMDALVFAVTALKLEEKGYSLEQMGDAWS